MDRHHRVPCPPPLPAQTQEQSGPQNGSKSAVGNWNDLERVTEPRVLTRKRGMLFWRIASLHVGYLAEAKEHQSSYFNAFADFLGGEGLGTGIDHRKLTFRRLLL